MMCLVGKGLLDLQNAPSSGKPKPSILPSGPARWLNNWSSLRPLEAATRTASQIPPSRLIQKRENLKHSAAPSGIQRSDVRPSAAERVNAELLTDIGNDEKIAIW